MCEVKHVNRYKIVRTTDRRHIGECFCADEKITQGGITVIDIDFISMSVLKVSPYYVRLTCSNYTVILKEVN